MSDSQALEPTSVQTGAEVAAAGDAPPAVGESGPPARWSGWSAAINGIINFVSLGAKITALVTAAILLKEGMHRLKRRMERNAATAVRLAEFFSGAGVDPYHQGLTLEASRAFNRAAAAAEGVAAAADSLEAHAKEVDDAHKTEYGGFFELAQSSPYDQPKAGFNKVT